MTTSNRLKNKLHHDGLVTYWSVYEQRWVCSDTVSDKELAAMDEKERARVTRHLRRHSIADRSDYDVCS